MDFDDELDLLEDDGDGVVEVILMEEERKKGANNNSGCCIVFLAIGSSVMFSLWCISNLLKA